MPRAIAVADPDALAVLPGVRWALARDLRLALRSPAELGVELLFYVIVVSLFPLATTPERTLLATMGDPQFVSDATKSQIDINPSSGAEVEAFIARIAASSPEVVERARRATRAD